MVGAARRREDPEIDLGAALGRVWRAADDRHLVDDDVAPAEGRAEPVRPDCEQRDEDRHRDPGPLAPVEPAEDDVVDRADQDDVAEQEKEEPTDRWQGHGRKLLNGTEDLAVVGHARRGRGARRNEAPPELSRRLRIGDPADRRIEPHEAHRAAAVRRICCDDTVTRGDERSTMIEAPGQGRDIRGARRRSPEEGGQGGCRDIVGRGRPVRQDRIGKAGQDGRTGGSADDHETAAEGEPAPQRADLVTAQGVCVDVLPDEAVQRGPRLDPIRQIGRGQRHRDRRDAVLVCRQLQLADEPLRPRGDDADDQLRRVVDRERDLFAGNGLVAADEQDLELLAEARRLGVDDELLVGRAGEIDREREAGSSLGSALESELTDDRRTVVVEMDLDRQPRTDPGVALEKCPGVHRRSVCRGDLSGQAAGEDQSGQGGNRVQNVVSTIETHGMKIAFRSSAAEGRCTKNATKIPTVRPARPTADTASPRLDAKTFAFPITAFW